MAAVLNQPVVIDNGTGIIKAGFAGADKPKARFQCLPAKAVAVGMGGMANSGEERGG